MERQLDVLTERDSQAYGVSPEPTGLHGFDTRGSRCVGDARTRG